MTFKGFKGESGWVSINYATTWQYGYDFMLDAAQMIVDDFGEDLQRIAKAEIAGVPFDEILDKVNACGDNLRGCPALKEECGVIAVAGISRVMQLPMQIVFYNQTNAVRLDIPVAQIPSGNPARKAFEERKDQFEHVFDCYMDSVEIKAYCADTKRKTKEELMSER